MLMVGHHMLLRTMTVLLLAYKGPSRTTLRLLCTIQRRVMGILLLTLVGVGGLALSLVSKWGLT